jgi:hypothetical protein
MNAASMQYEPALSPVSGAPAAQRRLSGTTGITARRVCSFKITTKLGRPILAGLLWLLM